MANPCILSSPRSGKTLRIFAILFLVLILCCGGVVTYIYLNFRGLVAGIVRSPMLRQIQSAGLPADQKAGIIQTIDRLTRDFQEDRLTYRQLARIFEELGKGPFFALVEIESARNQCLNAAQLNAEQREEAVRVFQRLQRGVAEGRISTDQVRGALALIQMTDSDNQRVFKPNLTAPEAIAFIDRIRAETKEAGVPDEPRQVDFAGQLQRAADRVLHPVSATRPAEIRPVEATE